MAENHPSSVMSDTEALAAKLHVGFPSLLKNSCRSGSDPEAVVPSLAIQLRINIRIHRPYA